MRTFVVIHHHCYGVSVYHFQADKLPSQKKIIAALNIDFEPDREEFIDIEEFEIEKLPIIE